MDEFNLEEAAELPDIVFVSPRWTAHRRSCWRSS